MTLPRRTLLLSLPPLLGGAGCVSIEAGVESLTEEGRAALARLAAKADVMLEAFRPGVAARLGLGAEALRAENPGLVVCSISGFGQSGPDTALPAYDIIVQALSGWMDATGEEGGQPLKVGEALGDIAAGLYAVIAILSAVIGSARTGQGATLDVAMLDCLVAMLPTSHALHLYAGRSVERVGNRHPLSTPFGAFRTNDGHAIIAVLGARQFRALAGLIGAPEAAATFRLSNASDAVVLPDLTADPVLGGWLLVGLMALLTAVAWLATLRSGRTPGWAAALFAVAFVAAFLIWVIGSADNTTVFLTGLIAGSFALAVPLIFGSMAGILAERSGVVNIAIEGQLLAGAFTAAVVGTATGSPWAGLAAAIVAGVLVSWLLAVFSIKYLVNQVIVGVVLNVLVAGLTSFLYSTVLTGGDTELNAPPHFPNLRIPGLADIPVLGPILFDQTILGYAMYLLVIALWFALFRTRWGLRVRAVGEHPKAADTVGIDVNRTRYAAVLLGGAVAGMGGAFFTLVSASSFTKEMTAGQGFIALAAVIFGRWNPIGAFFAALLFGFATNMQYVLAILGTPVPSQFMAMLPYLVTVFAVAGLVGRSRGPAASGVPYVKE